MLYGMDPGPLKHRPKRVPLILLRGLRRVDDV